MSAPTRPGMIRTANGVPLPLVAMPQNELLTVNVNQIPLLKNAMGPGIHIQTLRLDPEKGQVVLMAVMAPGCKLPVHYHTGTAEVYTFSGCWMYAEYPDQPQIAGSYLYEPGGSVHTFYCPEDNTEDTVVLLWMEGAQIGFNDDGTLAHINDATSIQHVTETVAEAQGVGPVGYIHGGEAGVVKS
jgi:quercetin dioxygenase-like cupin family protein